MRIPTLGALTLAAAAAVVAVPTAANAAPPVAGTDTITQADAGRSKAFNVLANDTLGEGSEGTLTLTDEGNAAHGSVSCQTDGDCFYTAVRGYGGPDSFTYTVSDGTETAEGTVNLTVLPVDSVSNLVTDPDTGKADSRVTFPESVNIETKVKDQAGNPVEGVTVGLYQKPAGSEVFTLLFSANTNASGKVAQQVVQPRTQTQYKWSTMGGHDSASRTVSVTPLITVKYTNKKVSVGDDTIVDGTLAPASVGDTVNLEKLTNTGVWKIVDTATIAADSVEAEGAPFQFSILATASRSTTYRVAAPADSGRNEAVSATAKVKAYQADVTNVTPGTSAKPDEWVTVANTGKVSIQLEDWKLTNGTNTLTLPVRSIAAGEFVRIHTGTGKNSVKNLFLKKANIWNNNGGTATLTDANGHEIEAFQYGEQ